MRKKIRIAVYFILFIVVSIGFETYAEAADTLPPGYLVGDDTGLMAGNDGKYFIREDDIKPGMTFDRTITISNYSNEEGTFSLKLVMAPEDAEHKTSSSGEVDLLTAVTVTLTYQGKQIYTGPIDGNGTPIANKKTAPIQLGELETGEVRTIKAVFKVSDAYPKSAWKNVNSADFFWLFYGNREETNSSSTEESSSTSGSTTESSNTDTTGSNTTSSNATDSTPTSTNNSSGGNILGKLPQTGEDWRNVILGGIVGGIVVCVVLIVAKKRKEKQ